jgi:thermostable 8-oxoguanine DNA glycosylase
VVALFLAEGIETQNDLKQWLLTASNLHKLRAIKGIGPKTIDYFKILVGISTSAIDRHLHAFLGLAGLAGCNYVQAQSIINAAADLLGQSKAYFDHSIWQYMSQSAAASRVSQCRKE